MNLKYILLIAYLISFNSISQNIPSDAVIQTSELYKYLNDDVKKVVSNSEEDLAKYFQKKFSERFFYDWQTTSARFDLYAKSFPDEKQNHLDRAKDHMSKFAATTPWLLPFNYQNGEKVNAYALRHLARQHKMIDISYAYFYDNKNPVYIDYFTNQMLSLNNALETEKYEKIEDGNGVYEAFRSGYRVLNWLMIHNILLGEKEYDYKDQLTTIATLLQHGENLYQTNDTFIDGNHQTRGVSALAMLSIVLRDFKGTEKWYDRSMLRLSEHLEKEINPDGFQFERSVHYHMSDIENYFYVYQLAKISNISLDTTFETQLKSLFTTLSKIAYPVKSAPVLQDDTDDPWAEKNNISGTMTLGYVLFEDPAIGYFADDFIDSKMYWFLNNRQLELLKDVKKQTPTYGSLFFPETAYFIMRQGWNKNDKMMIISNGKDEKKPDHQHGDMLGIQAMANGNVILPNYQVRYSLADFDFFKNSLVKNVALVDDELQGKKWTSNQGGSGFGKFGSLPNSKTISWESTTNFDFFAGSHDGFENVGVNYSRQVVYVKDDFWIVKDNFNSNVSHTFKQVWQGHYTEDSKPNLLRSNSPDASGLDIYQLIDVDSNQKSGTRGKEWTVVNKENKSNFNFITILYPYSKYDARIDETKQNPTFSNWKLNEISFKANGNDLKTLSKDEKSYLFNVSSLVIDNVEISFKTISDVYIEKTENQITLFNMSVNDISLDIKGKTKVIWEAEKGIIKPGKNVILTTKKSK